MEDSNNTDHKSGFNLTKYQIEIVEAVLEIFSEKGYFQVSFDEISNVLGITGSTIKYHFKSKNNLYNQVFNYCNNQLISFIEQDFRKTENVKQALKYIWINRARWGFKNPIEMKFIYTRAAFEINNLFEYEDKLLKKTINRGIKNCSLIGYQNPYYIVCLFYAFNNSIIISMIGKRYGNEQKIMVVKKAFNIFYEAIKRAENLQSDEINEEFPSE